jgi:hypothetical protein
MSRGIFRNDEHPDFHDTGYPDELDDAKPCSCGGEACFHAAEDDGDSDCLFCSKCDRKMRFNTGIEKAVEAWNAEYAKFIRETL